MHWLLKPKKQSNFTLSRSLRSLHQPKESYVSVARCTYKGSQNCRKRPDFTRVGQVPHLNEAAVPPGWVTCSTRVKSSFEL